jgi:hypothetical protein
LSIQAVAFFGLKFDIQIGEGSNSFFAYESPPN